MLKALLGEDSTEEFIECNDDMDFDEVLKFYGGEPTQHKLRCSDGTERTFSFDEEEKDEI